MPTGLIRAILGGIRHVIQSRLRSGREDELPELAAELIDWALAYRTPPEPLRRPRKPPALPPPAQDPHPQRARILGATTHVVAEKGYAAVTITEIAKRAAVSLSTFYALFESKGSVFLAAIDDAERRLTEAVVPIYGRSGDWHSAVRDTTHACFAFLASDPATAKICAIDVYAGGRPALERQEEAKERFQALLYPGFQTYPGTPRIAGEAIGNAVSALIFHQLRHAGARRLYEVAPTAVYLALAPFVGADEATAIANERWQPSV